MTRKRCLPGCAHGSRGINPGAAILDVEEEARGVAALFECGLYNPDSKSADVRRWLGEEALARPP